MQKIALITPGFLPVPAVCGGAVEELITKLIEANEREGRYEIDVFTIANPQLSNFSYRYARIMEVPVGKGIAFCDSILDKCARHLHWKKSVRLWDRYVRQEVRKQSYDILLIENQTSLYRCFHPGRERDNVFFHIHNNVDLYRAPEDFAMMAASGHKVLAVSDYIRNQVEMVAPGIQCSTFRNTVSRTRFFPVNEKERADGRKRWGIASDEVAFVYSGRIIPEKGVLETVQAFVSCYQKNAKQKLLIVGKGQFEKQHMSAYEQQVHALAAECEGVVFTGFVLPQEMRLVYGCADVVVMPTIGEEPFGMVALEAMSMGIPLIATKSGGLREFLQKDYALLLETGANLEQRLAQAMRWMVEHPEERRNMGDAAIAYLDQVKIYDEESYFQEFCSIIEK